MNKAYETMRDFWLDVKNLQHKREVPLLGERKICVAGVEIAARDRQGHIKNFMIAASSLGNASVYFENNSASGLGGFTGGAADGPVREKALQMLHSAAQTAADLLPAAHLAPQQNTDAVTLFVVDGEGHIYAKEITEASARDPKNNLYAFFAYSQQLLGAFRTEQEASAAAASASSAGEQTPPAASGK